MQTSRNALAGLAKISRAVAAAAGRLQLAVGNELSVEFLRLRYRKLCAERNRVVRVGLGLALMITAGAVYGPELLYTTSSDAIINARTVVLTAPIEGKITAGPPREGTAVRKGEPLLSIANPSVDNSRLNALLADQDRTNAKLNSIKNLAVTLQLQLSSMRTQAEGYQKATVSRLESILKETKAAAAAARADATAATLDYQRVRLIEQSGALSASDIDQSRQRSERTTAEMNKADAVVNRTAIELRAAREGIYVYQDRNNVTYSEQHAGEIAVRLAELDGQRAELEAQAIDLWGQIDLENVRVNHLSRTEIASPLDGIVWRPVAVSGMHVPRDSELLTVIDCSDIYVTAAFAGRKFESVHPGDQASIKVEGSSETLTGVVIDVRAVESSEPSKRIAVPLPVNPDHRVIAVLRIADGLSPHARADYCGIGRKAEVRLKGAVASSSVAQHADPLRPATLSSSR
jgi:multidrug resistance efflux pump